MRAMIKIMAVHSQQKNHVTRNLVIYTDQCVYPERNDSSSMTLFVPKWRGTTTQTNIMIPWMTRSAAATRSRRCPRESEPLANGVAVIFFLGGATRYIFGTSPGADRIQWGGGAVVAEIFRDLYYYRIGFSGGGGVVAEIFRDLYYYRIGFSGGGGVVAEIFRDLYYRIGFSGGGGSSRNFSRQQINHINHIPSTPGHFWYIFGPLADHPPFMDTLAEIQGLFPCLLTHSNHVTTSIHSGKKHLQKVWGGPWPPCPPPGYATAFGLIES